MRKNKVQSFTYVMSRRMFVAMFCSLMGFSQKLTDRYLDLASILPTDELDKHKWAVKKEIDDTFGLRCKVHNIIYQ